MVLLGLGSQEQSGRSTAIPFKALMVLTAADAVSPQLVTCRGQRFWYLDVVDTI
jgi:hypothetical protein